MVGRGVLPVAEYSFTVYFVPIKSPLIPSLLAQHFHIKGRTTCLPMTQGPEMG